jgi:hypothetical protein
MEVILLEDMTGVGQKGATVNVKPGFARNYLLPRKLAIPIGTKAANLYQELSRQKEAQTDKMLVRREGRRRQDRRAAGQYRRAGERRGHAVRLDHECRRRRRAEGRRSRGRASPHRGAGSHQAARQLRRVGQVLLAV